MKNVNSEEKTNKRISVTFGRIDSKWEKQGLSSKSSVLVTLRMLTVDESVYKQTAIL